MNIKRRGREEMCSKLGTLNKREHGIEQKEFPIYSQVTAGNAVIWV